MLKVESSAFNISQMNHERTTRLEDVIHPRLQHHLMSLIPPAIAHEVAPCERVETQARMSSGP